MGARIYPAHRTWDLFIGRYNATAYAKKLASRSSPVASGLGALEMRFNFLQCFAFRLRQKQRRGQKIDHRAGRKGEEHGAVAKLPYGWQKPRRNSRRESLVD